MKKRNHTCARLSSCFYWICSLLNAHTFALPVLKDCEILEQANITCRWTAVTSENTSYVLSVNKTNCENNSMTVGSCRTTHTQCSVTVGSVSHCFCVDVRARSPPLSSRSPRHCFNGINAVKMYPPEITALNPVPGKSKCLALEWKDDWSAAVKSERGFRVLQIEYSTYHQTPSRSVNTSLHNWHMDLCHLHPGTKYSVRARAQDTRAAQHWSSWSGVKETTTAEAAPGAAPELWRHIQPLDAQGRRRITLLWKPLQWPDSNGVILNYAMSCDNDTATSPCASLDSSNISCTFFISADSCTCNLTASNSAGTSPSAHIHIPGAGDTVLPPPLHISVTPLDDFKMKVDWIAAVSQSETSFVLEWFALPDRTPDGLHWRILNGSARSFIITDGIHPEVPYNVSLRICHKKNKKEVWAAKFDIVFTRQGAPSVGPKLEVLQTASNHVTLKWRAPPLETLRGFVQNYTLLSKVNGKIKSEVLKGNVEQFRVSEMSSGEYSFCVKVHTVAGGAEGPWVTIVLSEKDYLTVMTIVLCTVGFLLVLIIVLSQAERIQLCFCSVVPDPSKSSLSTWALVSQSQNKLRTLSFKPVAALSEPISVGGKRASHDHNEQSQVRAFSHHVAPSNLVSGKSKSMICAVPCFPAADKQMFEEAFGELDDEEPSEKLTTDLSYMSSIRAQPQRRLQHGRPSVSEVYPVTDPAFSGKNSEPGCGPAVSSKCTFPSKSCDAMDPDKLLCDENMMSGFRFPCYTNGSSRYLSAPQSFLEFRTMPRTFADHLHKGSPVSRSHRTSDCPQTSMASYDDDNDDDDDYVTVNIANCLHPNLSKNKATGYIHVSTSYLPCPLFRIDSASEAEDTTYASGRSGPGSCQYNLLHPYSCPDFKIDDASKQVECQQLKRGHIPEEWLQM